MFDLIDAEIEMISYLFVLFTLLQPHRIKYILEI